MAGVVVVVAAVGWRAGGGISGFGGCRARRGRPRFLLTGGWVTGIIGAMACCFFKLQRLVGGQMQKQNKTFHFCIKKNKVAFHTVVPLTFDMLCSVNNMTLFFGSHYDLRLLFCVLWSSD